MQSHQHPSLNTVEMAGRLSREGSMQRNWEKSFSNLLFGR